MKLRHALIATATAVALVAAPAIAAGPAQAAPEKASGTTLVSFKKEYAGIIKLIKPLKPAKFIGSEMTFPVVGVDGPLVLHKGGIKIGELNLTNPVIDVKAKKKRAKIAFSAGASGILVFYAKHFKIKADGVDGQVWQGNLHLVKNQGTVDIINEQLGVDSLTPGMGLGQIRVTIRK